MNKESSKPLIVSSQYTLPFLQLDPRRFEDLCLRVCALKYDLKNIEHPGRSGADGGGDIRGYLQKDGKEILIIIQVKRYEKISKGDLVEALDKILVESPNFSGEFWIITSASVSKNARDQFGEDAIKKNVNFRIIEGSVLEGDVRSLPEVLEEFFATPIKALSRDPTASKIIKRLQLFEDEFLMELDRSFAGNSVLINERQKLMGDILRVAMLELRSEMALFSENLEDLMRIQMTAMRMIGNYKFAGETVDGRPLWGADQACKALLENESKRAEFRKLCEALRSRIRQDFS